MQGFAEFVRLGFVAKMAKTRFWVQNSEYCTRGVGKAASG